MCTINLKQNTLIKFIIPIENKFSKKNWKIYHTPLARRLNQIKKGCFHV